MSIVQCRSTPTAFTGGFFMDVDRRGALHAAHSVNETSTKLPVQASLASFRP
jgi:hypothetical protein